MDNHDNQAALRRFVLDEAPSMAPLDRVRMIDGLRIITVDTSVSRIFSRRYQHAPIRLTR